MEKKSLSQQTAERLYTMIAVERRLAPGEKLPGEVELARELGVSPGQRLRLFPPGPGPGGAAGPLRAPGDL